MIPWAAAIDNPVSDRLAISIPGAAAEHASEIVANVRATFVPIPRSISIVAMADSAVGSLLSTYPGITPVLVPDPLHALVRSISAQQVNLKWAATVRRRLAERYGVRLYVGDAFVYSLDVDRLATATLEELRAIQLTTAKSRSVMSLAELGVAGYLDHEHIGALDDDRLIAHLTAIRGIGLWSAEWFIARTLGRPRVVAGDLGVRKAVGRMYRTSAIPTEREVREMTAHWGEAATHIQALALHDLAVR